MYGAVDVRSRRRCESKHARRSVASSVAIRSQDAAGGFEGGVNAVNVLALAGKCGGSGTV
jgi:hypothetical protein